MQEHEISQREAQRVAANDEGQEIHGGSFYRDTRNSVQRPYCSPSRHTDFSGGTVIVSHGGPSYFYAPRALAAIRSRTLPRNVGRQEGKADGT